MNVLRQWQYIREVVIPAAIKDAQTNPNNPWYKAYQNYTPEKKFK